MITHTIDSYQTPSQNKTIQIYKFKKFAKILQLCWNFACDTPSEVAW